MSCKFLSLDPTNCGFGLFFIFFYLYIWAIIMRLGIKKTLWRVNKSSLIMYQTSLLHWDWKNQFFFSLSCEFCEFEFMRFYTFCNPILINCWCYPFLIAFNQPLFLISLVENDLYVVSDNCAAIYELSWFVAGNGEPTKLDIVARTMAGAQSYSYHWLMWSKVH